MYYTLRKDYYWPHMAYDAYNVATKCRSCVRNRGTLHKHQKFLKLFPASGPLEFVAMDILGPLPKSHRGNRFILVITDRFTKLVRTVVLRDTKSATLAAAFLEHWVYAYGAPIYLLTDNAQNLIARFFESVCTLLGIKHFLTAAYHPQTNGQAERFNKTLIRSLRNYVTEHQLNWDDYIYPLTYAYNMQVHRTTGTTPFDLVLTRHPRSIALRDAPTGTEGLPDKLTPVQFKRYTIRRLRSQLATAQDKMTAAQKRYKEDFDRKVRFRPVINVGDEVYVDRPPLTLQARERSELERYQDEVSQKLLPRSYGPYKVEEVTDTNVAIRRDGLLVSVTLDRITKVPSTEPVQSQPAPSEEITTDAHRSSVTGPDDTEYPIERLVAHEQTPTGMSYKVRWYGYEPSDDTWLPAEDLPENVITSYWRTRSRQQRRRRTN